MAQLHWTTGFCDHPECGRYIGHFGRRVHCPQCGKKPPNQSRHPLETFGLDYLLGWCLGVFTCQRWSPSRVIERLFVALEVKPRSAEEIVVVGFLVLAVLLLGLAAGTTRLSTAATVGICAWAAYRLIEMLSVRAH